MWSFESFSIPDLKRKVEGVLRKNGSLDNLCVQRIGDRIAGKFLVVLINGTDSARALLAEELERVLSEFGVVENRHMEPAGDKTLGSFQLRQPLTKSEFEIFEDPEPGDSNRGA